MNRILDNLLDALLVALGTFAVLAVVFLTASGAAEAASQPLSSGRAATVDLTVTNMTSSLTDAQITTAELAVTVEVNTDFRRFWNVPAIQFVPSGGVPILLYQGKGIWGAAAAHELSPPFNNPTSPTIPWAFVSTGKPSNGFTVVGSGGRHLSWTVALDHEVQEMLVNPMLDRYIDHRLMVETCDAVEASTFRINGVQLSDFVLPRWFGFEHIHTGRFDFLGRVHRRFEIAPGGYMPGSLADKHHNAL